MRVILSALALVGVVVAGLWLAGASEATQLKWGAGAALAVIVVYVADTNVRVRRMERDRVGPTSGRRG